MRSGFLFAGLLRKTGGAPVLWMMTTMENSRSLKITFNGPAKHWTDAIPIGNGRLGAMIWGGVALETLQLNEDTPLDRDPGNYTNPHAPEALSVVRKLVDNGQYAEATTAAEKSCPMILLIVFFIVFSPPAFKKLQEGFGKWAFSHEEAYGNNNDYFSREVKMIQFSTAERVKSFKTDEDPSLVELLFQYGRYLLISCSRPGTQVANLQGIWTRILNHHGVNYEAKGWVAHQVSDIWAKTSRIEVSCMGFVANGRGLALYTLVGALYLHDGQRRGGYLETNPSTSPEHMFIDPDGKPASVSYSSTMDMSIIKEVFSAIISAAEVFWANNEDGIVQKVREAQPRLLPTRIARDGSLMEWAVDFEDPEIHHRHRLRHAIVGHWSIKNDWVTFIYPSSFFEGEEGPGWSLCGKLHCGHAFTTVNMHIGWFKHLFDLVDPDHESNYEGGLYGNLFTSHPPFQIDANFGFSAAIAEMLFQSTVKDLYLLPALPRNKWANGCVKGLKARGGVTVNVCWKEGDLHEVGLWSKEHHSIRRLHYRGTIVNANLSPGRAYTFNRQLRCIKTYALPSATSY
ncbi:hypothetical protein POTOM_061239 [Populus tomentosa]|uniref:Uncharacterized protein n=1 Tax=Populus tomentosa TaxID=118781 RepID=A0A8X7XPU6_POPTO|nr:hypothetical protein POTOM_061239 [Populus tomentosa]